MGAGKGENTSELFTLIQKLGNLQKGVKKFMLKVQIRVTLD